MQKTRGKAIFELRNNVKNKGSIHKKINFKSNVQKITTAFEDTILTLLKE